MHFLCASAYYKILCRGKKIIISPDMIQLQFNHAYLYVSLTICIFEKPFAILYLKVSYLSNNKHFFLQRFSLRKHYISFKYSNMQFVGRFIPSFRLLKCYILCTYLSTLAYIIRVIDTIF